MIISLITYISGNVTIPQLQDTLESVLQQTYHNIDYLVIDSISSPSTIFLLESYREKFGGSMNYISSPGTPFYSILPSVFYGKICGDVLGFLPAGMYYSAPVVLDLVAELLHTSRADAVYGDIYSVSSSSGEGIYHSYKSFGPCKMRMGQSLPLAAFYCRVNAYLLAGIFDSCVSVTSDFELMLRLIYKNRIPIAFFPYKMVTSTIFQARSEEDILDILHTHHVYSNRLLLWLGRFI